MWRDNKEVLTPSEKEKMQLIQSKMETVLDHAAETFQDEGVCVFVLYKCDTGLRIANISNIKTDFLIAAMREWIKTQEGSDERDRFDG